MLDSWGVTEWLTRFGFCAILHGHTHRSFYRWMKGFKPSTNRGRELSELVVAGTGSFSLKHPTQANHEFHLLSFRKAYEKELVCWGMTVFRRSADSNNAPWECCEQVNSFVHAANWSKDSVEQILNSASFHKELRYIRNQVSNLDQWARLRILRGPDSEARVRFIKEIQAEWVGKKLVLSEADVQKVLEGGLQQHPPTAADMVSFDLGDYWKKVLKDEQRESIVQRPQSRGTGAGVQELR
jgi:hypothetical protein